MKSVVQRRQLGAGALAAMLVSAAAAAGYAWLVGPLVRVLEGNSGATDAPGLFGSRSWAAGEIALVLVGLGLARALAEALRTRLSARLQLEVIREFRGKLLRHVMQLDPAIRASWPSGELASRIQVEVHGVRTLLHLGLIQGIRSLLVAIVLASVALRVDTELATPGLLVLPIAVLAIALAARPGRRLQKELFAAETAVVAETTAAVEGAAVLQAYRATESVWTAIDRAADRSARQGVVAESWSAVAGPLVELAGASGIALVFAVGWARGASVDLASAGTVLVALLLMYRPLHGLAQSMFGWWSGLASLDRLDELWRLPDPSLQPQPRSPQPPSIITLDEVSFDYGDDPVLREVSASFRAGELVAISGDSGAGKSTLLGLLAGVLPAATGGISFDGAPASRATRIDATAWMPQTPSLFGETILRNVALGPSAPDRRRVMEACVRVDAHDFISARPLGYDGQLREAGSDLSTGQRQRLTLARALYKGAPILLLDEPSSALGPEHERAVIRACRSHAERGGIVIVATHREDFLRQADRVLELRSGTLVEWQRRNTDALLH